MVFKGALPGTDVNFIAPFLLPAVGEEVYKQGMSVCVFVFVCVCVCVCVCVFGFE